MGQAKRRGTFEQRLAQAKEKQVVTLRHPIEIKPTPVMAAPSSRHRIRMAAVLAALAVQHL